MSNAGLSRRVGPADGEVRHFEATTRHPRSPTRRMRLRFGAFPDDRGGGRAQVPESCRPGPTATPAGPGARASPAPPGSGAAPSRISASRPRPGSDNAESQQNIAGASPGRRISLLRSPAAWSGPSPPIRRLCHRPGALGAFVPCRSGSARDVAHAQRGDEARPTEPHCGQGHMAAGAAWGQIPAAAKPSAPHAPVGHRTSQCGRRLAGRRADRCGHRRSRAAPG